MAVEDSSFHAVHPSWSPDGYLNPIYESIEKFQNFTSMYYNISSLTIKEGGIESEDLRIQVISVSLKKL